MLQKAENLQKDSQVNKDYSQRTILRKSNNMQFIFFFRTVKKAPFWNVTRNIIIPRVPNFTPLLHINQAETSNAIKNIFNNVQGNCQGTNRVSSSSLWNKIYIITATNLL